MEFAPCKGIREILHVESGILEIFDGGILNPGSWIPEYSCRNPEFKFHKKISGIRLVEFRSKGWNPEFKTVLDSLTWGDGTYCSLLS